MHIKSIHLKNFKSFKEIIFFTNEKNNIIIGENNTGKSSIFEATLLWKKCFTKFIRPNYTDFFKAGIKYIPFVELSFIRAITISNIFNSPQKELSIIFNIFYNEQEFKLGFNLNNPQSITDSYIRVSLKDSNQFQKFAAALKSERIKLSNIINIYQTKPVANIMPKEPFMNKGQVLKKIALGKSGDVLRNKIIQLDDINKISEQVSTVIGYNTKFHYENKSRRETDEYIDLKIEAKGKKSDISLQGSGLLQITEIFSTIELFSDKSLNLLLIDEPDSHIHIRLQDKLLKEIKNIANTQTFIISHNDNFVSKANDGELFYINDSTKTDKELKPLDLNKYDEVKIQLGGIITALYELNSSNTICFAEGEDDIEYINNLALKYSSVIGKAITKKPIFFYLRGKGELLKKIEYYKRLLPQIATDKVYGVIYDKDFCTTQKSLTQDSLLTTKLGQSSLVFRHNGYCIESTLFSEPEKLICFLAKISNKDIEQVRAFVNDYLGNLKTQMLDPTSKKYQKIENQFKGQKNGDNRPELKDIDFSDFIRCAYGEVIENHQFVFNKSEIKLFIEKFEETFSVTLITIKDDNDNCPDFYSSTFFNLYIENIESVDDVYSTNLDLLNMFFEFN